MRVNSLTRRSGLRYCTGSKQAIVKRGRNNCDRSVPLTQKSFTFINPPHHRAKRTGSSGSIAPFSIETDAWLSFNPSDAKSSLANKWRKPCKRVKNSYTCSLKDSKTTLCIYSIPPGRSSVGIPVRKIFTASKPMKPSPGIFPAFFCPKIASEANPSKNYVRRSPRKNSK